MPKITVDGKTIDAKDRQMVLQACLDAGIQLPHYCYHPGLSIPASCRICLVDVEGIPKLVPSCQTPVRDGMVVHSKSPRAIANQKQVMEYLLVSHPLDCPVCDKAGECSLQDYSYEYGRSESRFEEDKAKKPKKDIGRHVLLYNDRCILCTRCVRFTREISGTAELCVEGRGYREEIDIFPGRPLDNPLSGNVVDLCPVGALLDKEFLFQQRVWLLKGVPSISPVDAGGENIILDHNDGRVWRIKPRYNAAVNTWWISDDTRHSYQVLYDAKRLTQPMKSQFNSQVETTFPKAVDQAATDLKRLVTENGPGSLYAILSPMMACEEAWLCGRMIRSIDPQAILVLGPVPTSGENQIFKNGLNGKPTFEIQAEKVPNAAGVRRVIEMLGGPTVAYGDLVAAAVPEVKKLKGGWINGGYLSNWLPAEQPILFKRGYRVVQDVLATTLSAAADVLLPGAMWAEKNGCWENHAGVIQAFEAAVAPPEGARREGDVYLAILGQPGLYDAGAVRREMGEPFASVAVPVADAEEPVFEFAEL